MSPRPISHSEDLRRLVGQGFELEIRCGHLLVHHVPYVNPAREVQYGTLVMALTLAGEVTARPHNHVAWFAGDVPCDADGKPLDQLITGSRRRDLGSGVLVDHHFSRKPTGGYRDYEHKVTTYVGLLSGPAGSLDPAATARTFQPVEESPDESPFVYIDTATPRAGLEVYAERVATMRLAIVGLGGTGSYILDLVSKTQVAEIHLYDGDRFQQHNPFRSPGATAIEELLGGPNKAEHWADVYRRMRRGIVPHPSMVDATNVEELRGLDFVFVAIDSGPSRAVILDALANFGVTHIDVGMGIHDVDDRLSGKTRVSVGTASHPMDRRRVPTEAADREDDYRHNIQIAELNALNATLAVIRWKKLIGIYADLEHEHSSTYTSLVNEIVNEDCA